MRRNNLRLFCLVRYANERMRLLLPPLQDKECLWGADHSNTASLMRVKLKSKSQTRAEMRRKRLRAPPIPRMRSTSYTVHGGSVTCEVGYDKCFLIGGYNLPRLHDCPPAKRNYLEKHLSMRVAETLCKRRKSALLFPLSPAAEQSQSQFGQLRRPLEEPLGRSVGCRFHLRYLLPRRRCFPRTLIRSFRQLP